MTPRQLRRCPLRSSQPVQGRAVQQNGGNQRVLSTHQSSCRYGSKAEVTSWCSQCGEKPAARSLAGADPDHRLSGAATPLHGHLPAPHEQPAVERLGVRVLHGKHHRRAAVCRSAAAAEGVHVRVAAARAHRNGGDAPPAQLGVPRQNRGGLRPAGPRQDSADVDVPDSQSSMLRAQAAFRKR